MKFALPRRQRKTQDNPAPEIPERRGRNITNASQTQAEHPNPESRTFTFMQQDFLLQHRSPSTIRVRYQDQTGHFGIQRNWDPQLPFAWTIGERSTLHEGIDSVFGYGQTPDQVLRELCQYLLREQRKLDAQNNNPEEHKQAARHIMQEMLLELPLTQGTDAGTTDTGSPPDTTGKQQADPASEGSSQEQPGVSRQAPTP